MPIDRKKVKRIVGYNRGDLNRLRGTLERKLASFIGWMYRNLRAGPEWERWFERGLRGRRIPEIVEALRPVVETLSEVVRAGRTSARGYARAIVREFDLARGVEALEKKLPDIQSDLGYLNAAIALKEKEEDLLADTLRDLLAYLPTETRGIEETERVLRLVRKRLEELREMLPPVQRISISLYIIISRGEKSYSYPPPTGKRYRRYPSGKFQSTWEADAEVDPDGKFKIDEEDMKLMKNEFLYEVETEFEAYYDPDDVTVGISSAIPDQSDVGKPPKKLTIERVVDKPVPSGYYPRDSWQKTIGWFLERPKPKEER